MVKITLCMIVKNEEANLKSCLSSIKKYVDEIIIVDTGSQDRTKEIAKGFTDKIFDYVWNNDFSAARNYAINKVTNEFILVLDGDEFVESIDMAEIKRLAERHPDRVGRLQRDNEFSRNGVYYQYLEWVNRFFSRKNFLYKGIIHEQVVHRKGADYENYNIPLRIRHLGYEGGLDTRKRKTERNIMLLKQVLEQEPNDPYIIYQLGKSYYMQENYKIACNYFGQALYFDLEPRLEYVQDMVESYGYALMNTEQYDTAMQLINVYDEFAHSADFIFMIGLVLMNNAKFQEAVMEFKKAVEKPECKMKGVNDYLAYYNIGVIYECLGDFKNAKKYYLLCGNYDLAKQRLESAL